MDLVKSVTDLMGNIIDAFKQRVSSPVVGTFFFSWLIFNWRLVYYFMMSEEGAAQKIKHIELNYLELPNTLYWPLLLTIAYIILFPLVVNISNMIWVSVDSNSRSWSSKVIEENAPITKGEQARLFAHIRKREEEYKSVLESKDSEISSLTSALNYQLSDEKVGNASGYELNKRRIAELKDEVNKAAIRLKNYQKEEVNHPLSPTDKHELESVVLSKNVKSYLESSDGNYLFDSLIAKAMGLDKDDIYHSKELHNYKKLLLKVISCYPEPWPIQDFSAISQDGRSNVRLSKELVVSLGKKLISQDWLTLTEYAEAECYAMTPNLLWSLNKIQSK